MLQLEKALAASEITYSSLSERNSELQAEVTDYLLQFSKCEQEINALQLVRTSLEGCEGKTQQEVSALRLENSQLQSQLMEVQREFHLASAQVPITAAAAFATHCTANTAFHCECRIDITMNRTAVCCIILPSEWCWGRTSEAVQIRTRQSNTEAHSGRHRGAAGGTEGCNDAE